jgi:hypothetical protein
MIFLVIIGVMLGVAVAMAVAMDFRDRRSRRRRVESSQIDAIAAQSFNVSGGGGSVGEYLPPPDDGRPQH